MTIKQAETPPFVFWVLSRIGLGLLVMILAERVATVGLSKPGSAAAAFGDEDAGLEASSSEDPSQPSYTAKESEGSDSSAQQRLREGTRLVDVVGKFRVAGDRATFTINESGQRFGGLENLNLARVSNTIRDDPEADWSVTGLVTEYRGSNYILIQKAIRKTSTQTIRTRESTTREGLGQEDTDALSENP